MKIYIGSYNEGLYSLNVNKETEKIVDIEQINNESKPAFIMGYDNELSYIFNRDGKQLVKIKDQEVELIDAAAHISYDEKNHLIYVAHYHAAKLSVLSEVNGKWEVTQLLEFKEGSKVHYVSYISTIDKVGVTHVGENKLRLFNVENGQLVEHTSYQINRNVGPRHFTYNQELPFIYIVGEVTPSITVLKYENNSLELAQEIELVEGVGSTIKITKDNNFVYAGVRKNNFIYGFRVLKNGLLEVIQKVQTLGDHARDFNLVLNDEYLLTANMHSNDLTLFKVEEDGHLTLKDSKVPFDAGAVVITL